MAAIVVPNGAEQLIIGYAVNKNTPENPVMKLYTNDYTPIATSVVGDFTEASGGGYAAKTLTGSSWTLSTNGDGKGQASYAQQTWTFTGALSGSATIYGYFVVRASSGDLIWAQRVTNSFTPANNGDTFLITPVFTAASEN